MSISGSKAINGTLLFTGVPSTSTTYTSQGSSTLAPHAFQVTSGIAAWVFTGGAQANPLGSYSLKYSSVTSSLANVYVAHGTLDVNLVPAVGSGATGTATAHVVF
jgi:hypothetical protein